MMKRVAAVVTGAALLPFVLVAAQNHTSLKGNKQMLLGLRTCQYHVKTSDLKVVRDWYAHVLGIEPYFDESFYVGFDVEGFELGLVPDDSSAGQLGSVFAYWGVSDIGNAVDRLVTSGARKDGDIEDVGAGIRKASFIDPFGNRFSIIENPHFEKGQRDIKASQGQRD